MNGLHLARVFVEEDGRGGSRVVETVVVEYSSDVANELLDKTTHL